MDLCDKGLELYKKLEALPKDKAMTDELREIRDSLSRLKKAAERLVLRRQAEAAFRNLGVRVTGVVWQPMDSRAVVNGQVVRKGNILAVGEPSAGENVYVEDILPEQVIVNYRGYKMRLALGTAE
jgi:hypothetical protein